ncbi:MAG: hypothetical protein VZS44_05190 [Bacilli bacterium]|nr:hypothetical protein [Bacilli bacterium]
MDDSRFSKTPFSPFINNTSSIFPGNKGILLFYSDGNIKELYGREHVMMMQEIGYWYIDNWQDFLLNYSYNGVIVMMIEYDTLLVYLPKNMTLKQRNSFINYVDDNVIENNKRYLSFYVMYCLEENNNSNNLSIIDRDNKGMIRTTKGVDITGDKPLNWDDLYNFIRLNNLNKCKILENN